MHRMLWTTALAMTMAAPAMAQVQITIDPKPLHDQIVEPTKEAVGNVARAVGEGANRAAHAVGNTAGRAVQAVDDAVDVNVVRHPPEQVAVAPAVEVEQVRASTLLGMRLYAYDPKIAEANGFQPGPDAIYGLRRDWDDVGEIDDLIMTPQGQVEGVVVDIGGFLGIGERQALIAMDDVWIVDNPDTPGTWDTFAVVAMTRASIEALPEWDADGWSAPVIETSNEAAAAAAAAQTTTRVIDTATAPVASAVGQPVASAQDWPLPTAQELVGVRIVDATGADVGRVQEVVEQDGAVVSVLSDVGGFLGIGARRVALPFDAVGVVRHAQTGALESIRTALTKQQMQELPEVR